MSDRARAAAAGNRHPEVDAVVVEGLLDKDLILRVREDG